MDQITISADTIDDLVRSCWDAVIQKVTNGHPLSSEKTLCFLFAMALFEKVGHDLVIDFENQCYDGLEGDSRYLDLLFYTSADFPVAVEFKFPRSSESGGSDKAGTREAVYRDIARLNYLKSNFMTDGACYFLMATDERAYLNKGKYKKHADFFIHHGHKVDAENTLLVSGIPLTGTEFEFQWRSILTQGNKHVCDGQYAWLVPIKV